jgi:DmsE family decaheme c-type cytochrome
MNPVLSVMVLAVHQMSKTSMVYREKIEVCNMLKGRGLAISVTLLGLLACLSQAQAEQERLRVSTDAQFTAEGTKQCLRCHGGDKIAVIQQTPHGDTDHPDSPASNHGCESCHGPGSLHISRARGGAGHPILLQFKDGLDNTKAQTTACLDCHAQILGDHEAMSWRGSAHDTEDITCSSCHQVHVATNALKVRDNQVTNCSDCHEKQMKSHRTFADKGINFDQLTCFDCHDVHQLTGKD